MSFIYSTIERLPRPLSTVLLKHRELVKFAFVGGTAFLIDTGVFLTLKNTVLDAKPVTAKIIATMIATVVSYILNREWSFKTRGGRRRHHEAGLFFLVSGIGVVLNSIPLWISRYALHLETPHVSGLTEQVADFVAAQIIGTLIAMAFRWWAFRKYVFPTAGFRTGGDATAAPVPASPVAMTEGATVEADGGQAGPRPAPVEQSIVEPEPSRSR